MKKLAVILFVLSAAGCADSNEEFGRKVNEQIASFKADPKAIQAATDFCLPLSENRRSEEPRCVALQKLPRAGATPEAGTPRTW